MATTKATLLGHRSATSFSDLTLSGDLTVNGTTTTLDTAVQNVDKLEIGASSTDYGAKINQASTGNILQLQDGGTDVMVVADGGNVGIGSTNPIDGILVVEKPSSNSDIAIKSGGSGTHSQLYHITASRRYNVGVHGTTSKYFIYDNNANSTRLEINTTGDVTVGQGNLVIGTAGKGIDFSQQTTSSRTGVTPDTSAGAEVLDHYEEGTWLPVMESNGAQPVVTYNNRFGTYTRIGNRVIAEFGVNITVNTAHGGVTAIDTAGLPFAPKSETLYEYSSGGYCLRSKASNEEAIFFNNHNPASATRLYFMERESSSGSQIQSGVYSGVIIYRTS